MGRDPDKSVGLSNLSQVLLSPREGAGSSPVRDKACGRKGPQGSREAEQATHPTDFC